MMQFTTITEHLIVEDRTHRVTWKHSHQNPDDDYYVVKSQVKGQPEKFLGFWVPKKWKIVAKDEAE